ncbi:DUF2993 domain-containing protein [Jatrophihabitans sp.]|uniref:LmeA family phospholipid-binding protein n=1 Tax=Jatrophihabitans sp. TaxID=1932789 RepID=UPI0030C6F6A5|nr:hypothetical protein [Jatrophihabitans sp.]
MTILLIVLVIVIGLAIWLALSDQVIARLAERKASEYLEAPLGVPARVRLNGTPFLTQALRGRYTEIEVTSHGLQLGDIAGASLSANLFNSYLPLRDLLGGRARELPCERVVGHVVLPYSELARVAKVPGLSLTFEEGQLIAAASLPVPGISQLARVSGRAELTVTGGSGVWLRVRGIAVAGISLPGIVVNQLLPALNVPIPLPPLPYGLALDSLQPRADGILASGSARAVVFRRLPVPGR